MGDERALTAIQRIERALERIEAAAAHPSAISSAEGDERLRVSHDALKGKVVDAIAQIDRLLAEAR